MFGLRKFYVTVGVIAVASGFLAFSKVTSDNFVDLMKWIVGLYMAGNIGERFSPAKSVAGGAISTSTVIASQGFPSIGVQSTGVGAPPLR